MFKSSLLRLFVFFFPPVISLFPSGYTYELGICTMFKDDVAYLPEWIEFHQKQGVQKFWLYNNGGGGPSDYEKYLTQYIEEGLIEVIEWPFLILTESDFGPVQTGAFDHCIGEVKRDCKWLAVIDTDEFLFAPDGRQIPEVLSEFNAFGSVGVHWVMYGISNVPRIEEGEKMTNHLLI